MDDDFPYSDDDDGGGDTDGGGTDDNQPDPSEVEPPPDSNPATPPEDLFGQSTGSWTDAGGTWGTWNAQDPFGFFKDDPFGLGATHDDAFHLLDRPDEAPAFRLDNFDVTSPRVQSIYDFHDPFAGVTCADLGVKPGQAAFLWGTNPDDLHGFVFMGGQVVNMGVSAIMATLTLESGAPIFETLGPLERVGFDQINGAGMFDPKADELLNILGVKDSGTYCFIYQTDVGGLPRFFK